MSSKRTSYILLLLFLGGLTGCMNATVETGEKNTVEIVEPGDNADEREVTETKDNSAEDTTKQVHDTCKIENVDTMDEGKYSCSYEGVKHDFILDMPQSIENAPLVVMLHGYGESAEGFRSKSSFHQEANALGYGVVYVTGAPSPTDATSANGWNSGVGEEGNDDVGFLCGLVNYLCETYGFDSNRVYAVGFSNGAFMTHRLAVEAGDVFSSVVSVAGMMPEMIWEEKESDCSVGVFQITGEKDDVVPKNSDGSAKYAQAPAIEDVMSYYIESNKLTLAETSTIGKKSVLNKYSSSDASKQVWDLFIPDGRHSWPEEQITGINVNQLIMDYFDDK